MRNEVSRQKTNLLKDYIERHCADEHAVQAVIALGRLARGLATPESDIDAIVFLDPWDPYAVPAGFVWLPADFQTHLKQALASGTLDKASFDLRTGALRLLMLQVRERGIYQEDPVGEAFIRGYDEPGRTWNLREWKKLYDQISDRP